MSERFQSVLIRVIVALSAVTIAGGMWNERQQQKRSNFAMQEFRRVAASTEQFRKEAMELHATEHQEILQALREIRAEATKRCR